MRTFTINTPNGKRVLTSKQFYGSVGAGYRTVYKGRMVEVQQAGFGTAILRLKNLRDKGFNFVPVWQDVITAFQQNMRGGFDARITPDTPPERWTKLSGRYAKWKKKNLGTRMANLIGKTHRLQRAVYGGPGWFEKVQPTSAVFGIRGIDYAAAHQYGVPKNNLPARRFFTAKGDKLPVAIVNYMVKRIEDEFTGVA